MSTNTENYTTLNNGRRIPLVGLGTYNIPNTEIEELIYNSIKNKGLRLIDTAQFYKNEEEIGKAIKRVLDEGIIQREELFVITKLWPLSFNQVQETLDHQLKILNIDYIDLYLIHLPVLKFIDETQKYERISFISLWKTLEKLVEKGVLKSIGISNFHNQLALELINNTSIVPQVNEIELHPYLTQKEVLKFSKLYDIKIIGYNSLVSAPYAMEKGYFVDYNIFNESIIEKLAEKYNKTKGQIILNWSISQGVIVIPKTRNEERVKENLESADFRMSDEDIEEISKLNKNVRFNPGTFDFNGQIDFYHV